MLGQNILNIVLVTLFEQKWKRLHAQIKMVALQEPFGLQV